MALTGSHGPALAAIAVLASCSPYGGGAFTCTDDGQCTGASAGRCEPDGRCSFTDLACASGRRYGQLSGDRAGVCVGEVPDDGAVDGPGGGDGAPDSTVNAPFCDAGGEPTLVGCWEFEGTTADASGDANDATATNTSYAAGHVGMALSMAANSTVVVADSASLSPLSITIEAWIRPGQLPGGGARMGIMDNDGQYGFFLNSTGLSCTVVASVSATVAIPVGAWSHVACSYDGTTGRLYVDGLEVGSAPGGGGLTTGNTNGSSLGGNSPTGDRFIGAIDQVRVWSVARTATQLCAAAMASPCP